MSAEPKRYYPAFLDLTARLVIVVGGGSAAARKARQLVRYGADVTVIAPRPDPELVQAEADGHITVEQRGYVRGDLEG
ncbi:MAG: bifunctional precorrin-2 dehydrogenase/sirohydrochlorin ferrochelatase, partial [Actinobacteria bacterium]